MKSGDMKALRNPKQACCPDGFSDPNLTNDLRAERARVVLMSYQNMKAASIEESVTDLVVDLMHLLDSVDVEPISCVETALDHYSQEATS